MIPFQIQLWPGKNLRWLLGLFLLSATAVMAQPISNLVFTAGTSFHDTNGNHNWSYVLIGSPSQQLLTDKRFAVYGKAGFPTNSGSFSLRGTMAQQTDVAAINNLLNQSVALGDNLLSLSNALDMVLHNVAGATNFSLLQQVQVAYQVAATNSGTAAVVAMLARMHPGLALCSGQAFAEIVTGITTYEVRELDPNTGVPGDVLGRVTITPGSPVILPAPGFPFQVVTNAPSDHLRIRLRWGTPDALRRLSLLQFGFNVWRIPLAAAQSAGYDVTPPTTAQLHSDPNFKQVNGAPVMAVQDYNTGTGTGGANDPSDRTTCFISDSNGRSLGNVEFPSNSPPHPGYLATPFNDGDQFYYFITARDILGRDGLASPGGLGVACRRLPPQPPTQLRVLNTMQILPTGSGVSNQQPLLLLTWQQNTNTNDVVTEYWIYRWPNPAMSFTNDIAPTNNRIAIVAQLPGTNLNSYLDNGSNAPFTPGPSNYWYTVRAVSETACSPPPLLSANSAPAWGVLRQRAAPAAPTGEVIGSCGTPAVMFQQLNSPANPNGPDPNNYHYRVTCSRRDAGIAWVQIIIGNPYVYTGTQTFGPLYFPADGSSVSVDYTIPATNPAPNFQVTCMAGTYYGRTSQIAFFATNTPVPAGQIAEAIFQAGELLFTSLSSSDPLLQAVNANQGSCYPALNPARNASGTVSMQFDGGGGLPMMIQYATVTNAAEFWNDLGVALPDSNGVYSVYFQPCVLCPLPPFRGCTINIPDEGNCDQHIARAGNSGPIAPVLVKFRLTPRTHEYRLYRSVNGSEPMMIAQGSALYDPLNPGTEIVRADDSMPPSAVRLCYFVQTLDENGNGSPLALLGCKELNPPKPPRPVLSQPAPAGTTTNPLVALKWFCPTSGVYRFEIRIERMDQPGSGRFTGFTGPQLLHLVVPQPAARYFGVFSDRSLAARFDEWQLTPPIGPGFEAGPQFTLNASVLPNVPYHIAVAAEDNQGNPGDVSQDWTFTWQPPPTIATVPWPARPLPAVKDFDEDQDYFVPVGPNLVQLAFTPRVQAVLLTQFNQALDSHYPVGIRIGDFAPASAPITYNVGTTGLASYNPGANPAAVDPNNLVFQRLSGDPTRAGQLFLPIVVYRQQETNAAFPHVSGNLTQVTPLLERIAYNRSGDLVVIQDRLVAANLEYGNFGTTVETHPYLYLRDQQPVILGARYHYLVVRLDDHREVSEIIDAGTVDIPTTP